MNAALKLRFVVLATFVTGASSLLLATATSRMAFEGVGDSHSPRILYVQNCARCHGADGKANTSLGRKYKADDISGGVGVNKTIRIVTKGKGHMPSFKKRLSAAQIAQIANYVSGL